MSKDVTQANIERLHRAMQALDGHAWEITPTDAGYEVRTPNNTYLVTRPGEEERRATCTCEDFRHNGHKGIVCKHIQGVTLWLANNAFQKSQPKPTTEYPTEGGSMSDNNVVVASELERFFTELDAPLDMQRVKKRRSGGGEVPYLPAHDVINRANDVFNYRWSFRLTGQPVIRQWNMAVTRYDQQKRERVPVLDKDGNPLTRLVGLVVTTGEITVEFPDGKTYTHGDVGRNIFYGDTPEELDMAVAGAASDNLKRCFRQMGEQFGNSLYDKDTARDAVRQAGRPQPRRQPAPAPRQQQAAQAPAPNPASAQPDPLSAAKQVVCPVGSRNHPEWGGMPLGQVMTQSDGIKMIEYLAGPRFHEQGDPLRQAAKRAARTILQAQAVPAVA